jgi:hypothetical protein
LVYFVNGVKSFLGLELFGKEELSLFTPRVDREVGGLDVLGEK